MHQKQQPVSILKDRPDAPQDLVDICTKMMAKKPDQRYQTMNDVSRVLGDWLGKKGDSGSGSTLKLGQQGPGGGSDTHASRPAHPVRRQEPRQRPAKLG